MSLVFCAICGTQNSEFNPSCSGCGGSLSGARPGPLSTAADTVHRWESGETAPPELWIGRKIARYQVEDCLGHGSMGRVYRAVDTVLRRTVALKLLAPRLLNDPRAKARFLREAQAASALDHPHIGTVFEIGEHDGQPFISLAFYEGETLLHRMARAPMDIDEVRQILCQIASGLHAAHEAGVVHRDLKPSNVMLTRSGQIKLLDFGLAKQVLGTESTDAALTEGGTLLGTVAYMAPEQARGEEVDHRADLWSLGAVGYEMLAGCQPFHGPSSVAALSKILTEEPEQLAKLRPETPESLEALITSLLQKDPSRRPQNAGLVLQILQNDSQEVLDDANLVRVRPAIAVVGFKNLTSRPDVAWLSVALSEMLSTELATGEQLRVIPGEDVARMKAELALTETDAFGKESLQNIRRNLGTDLVVSGSYLALGQAGGKIRVDFRLQDAALGETIASASETCAEDEIFDLVVRAGKRLLARCSRPGRGAPIVLELVSRAGAGESPGLGTAGVRSVLPSNPDAARLYAEGLSRLRAYDAHGGRTFLEKAIAIEPEFCLAHWALAEAFRATGFDARAVEESRRAYELSEGLHWAERLRIEAQHRDACGQLRDAVELYRTLWESFPDRLEDGLCLAEAQTRAGKCSEALETVASLRTLQPPAGSDPRIDMEETRAAHFLGDYRRQRVAAATAVHKALAQGNVILAANARLWEGHAALGLGEPREARRAYEQARGLFASAKDRPDEARALFQLGGLLSRLGEADESEACFAKSLQICIETGDHRQASRNLDSLASSAVDQWDLDRALILYEQSLNMCRDIGDQRRHAFVLMMSASALFTQGQLDRARARYNESLAEARSTASRRTEALVLSHLATLLAAEGNLAESRERFADARAIFLETGARDSLAWALFDFGFQGLCPCGELQGALRLFDEARTLLQECHHRSAASYVGLRSVPVLIALAELDEARARAESALATAIEVEERETMARARLYLAWISLERGAAREAELVIRESISQMRAVRRPDGEAHGHQLLAATLLGQGRIDEAQTAIEEATKLYERNVDRGNRYSAEVLAARIQSLRGESHDFDAATASLENTRREAAASGFIAPQFEARLAIAQIEARSGRLTDARSRLEALEKDASALGFQLIAGQAASASKTLRHASM